MDSDNSGQVTISEFSRMMYCIELSSWPDLSPEERDRCVKRLNEAADKWHHSGGNWFKIFNEIDSDNSGNLAYDELKACVRGPYPGLRLKNNDFPDRDLRGLWKILDCTGDMEVPLYRFMVFMRRHGQDMSMHRLTEYSKKKRGLDEAPPELPPLSIRSPDEMRSVVARLEHALTGFYQDRGLLASCTSSMQVAGGGMWSRFFKETDVDNSGRLTFQEFTGSVASKLGKFLRGPDAKAVEPENLRALWEVLDPDGSKEVTESELSLSIYRLKVAAWPDDVNGDIVPRAIEELNNSMKRRLRAGGNWYKVFNLVDKDGSGRLGYEELKELVRDAWHGLAIPPERLSDLNIKTFWKALDKDQSGDVTVSEFMVFMRRHGEKHSMIRLTEYSKKMRGIVETEYDWSADIAAAPELDVVEMCTVATRLTLSIMTWLSSRGLRLATKSPHLWGQLIEFVCEDDTSRINFNEFQKAVRRLLKPEVTDSELMAFWRVVDEDKSNECSAMEFDHAVYKLQIETWPKLTDTQIEKAVGMLNWAADKWHRASGNWYKVFNACDEDGSGNMDFEELVSVVRKSFPGLSLTPKQISDKTLKGLWTALDTDRSGLVDVREFMVFMRYHGKAFSMHKLTEYSKKMRGLIEEKEELGELPSRTRDELRHTVTLLENALSVYWQNRGVRISSSSQWDRFFLEADEDGNLRLNFFELEKTLRARLQNPNRRDLNDASSSPGSRPGTTSNSPVPLQAPSMVSPAALPTPPKEPVIRGVYRDDLHALWDVVDADHSGEVTPGEWHLSLYRLMLEVWPDMPESELAPVVDKICAAAEKWHRAGGNWYKVFNLVDKDESGNIGYQELFEIIRRPLPCLAISEHKISDSDLKGLWKAMDEDASGEISVREFMVFMRRLEAKRGRRKLVAPAEGSVVARARLNKALAESARRKVLSEAEAAVIAEALKGRTVTDFQAFYAENALTWTGTVTEWDWLTVIRDFLMISEEALDEDTAFVAFRTLEGDMGEILVEDLVSLARC